MKSLCYENNYSRWLFLRKRSIVDVWQGFEYTRVLNMPRFSIYHDSEYAFCSVYARVLNMPGLQRVLKMPMLCLCLNMFEYARICVSITSSAWMAFVSNIFIVICLGCFLSSWEYLICFLSKTKHFASKISSLPLPLQTEGLGAQILMHAIYRRWFLMIYLSPFLCFFFCCCLLFLLLISHFLALQRT